MAAELGLDLDLVTKAWAGFGGVHRRFEFHGEGGGVRVYDDYAHHPTEIAASLTAARAAAGDGRLIAVFQPGTYSRTQTFRHEFAEAMAIADIAVVMDIFPRSERTGYFGDLTRTVVRGRASERLKEVYALVHEGTRLGHRRIRDGASGRAIHAEILALFTARGYPTGMKDGRMQGFFHGTGHGLGLEIHEAPSISVRPSVLRAGHVVTVEPGLYYLGIGGVRIEDVALVTPRGSKNLTRVPKFLEL